ncbi:universal stress protein [Mycobacterium sp. smrl_JER01]|uniref:universal stress protein n=1 Tax=Mycobacterium sp. smrl_JER01 TaxID=3402633 RepID=UPI003AD69E6C
MTTTPSLGDGPVVVGVDGSTTSLNAVRWACVEALARDACLRLVHAVPTPPPNGDAPGSDAVLAHAESVAFATPRSLRVETVSAVGAPGPVLLAESRGAAMVCIGSRSTESREGPWIGSLATVLADAAACPVAIIRTRADGTAQTEGVVSVVLTDDEDSDAVVHLAMHEGRLRHATVRQIDQRAASWVRRYPDVHVELVSAGTGHQYARRESTAGGVGLAVVGSRDARELASVRMPNCHPILGYPDCSMVVVRS